MESRDLASADHWNYRYKKYNKISKNWRPTDYNSRVIESGILYSLRNIKPKSLLEIGCGNSQWLPYLGKLLGASVTGIDYSESGCTRAESLLEVNEIKGKIYCRDFFMADPNEIGTYDFVYSLGLVEHFSDTTPVINSLLRYVKPGGVLFTEVPNMSSIHGMLCRLYQPSVFSKHQAVSLNKLIQSYQDNALKRIEGAYIGMFSAGIVAWGIEPRFPAIDPILLPFVKIGIKITDVFLNLIGGYNLGSRCFSPYIYVYGYKPLNK